METTNINELGYSKPITNNYQNLVEAEIKYNQEQKKKTKGRHKEKILLNLQGFKSRLRSVAKKEGKRHHTLAKDLIIEGVLRMEKKHRNDNM